MYNNGRKTIAVFLAEINADYQERMSTALSEQALELGYNLAFFTCSNNYSKNTYYSNAELNVLDIPNYQAIDGIILDRKSVV